MNDPKIKQQIAQQLYKPPNTRLIYSHITAQHVHHIWQMDLLDLSNLGHYNSNYKWILTLIDVYSRYVTLYPLKTKAETPSTLARVLEDPHPRPRAITSDNDAVFTSHETRDLMKKHGIEQFFVAKGDHRVLGLIDRFHRTLRRKLTLYMVTNNTNRWVDALRDIAHEYNHTPHTTLRDEKSNKLTPAQVYFKQVIPARFYYQYRLVQRDRLPKLGDYVRIQRELGRFEKVSMAQRWSSEVYEVIGVQGYGVHKYQLRNLQTHDILPQWFRPHQLQVIPKASVPEELIAPEITSEETKEKEEEKAPITVEPLLQHALETEKQKRKQMFELRREDIHPENIVTTKRVRKAPSRFEAGME